MDLSAELFDKISAQAVQAASKLVKLPEEPDGFYGFIDGKGALQLKEGSRPWRDHEVHSLGDFIAFVDNTHTETADAVDPEIVVWYSRQGVVAILDDCDPGMRRDKLTMPLTLSPQAQTLLALQANGKQHSQKDFVSLLRINLANCLNAFPTFLPAVRNLKITANSSGVGVVEHTRRSVGQSIEQEVSGAGSIPELVTVHLPIFENPPTRYDVQCAVEVDPNGPNFKLIPLPLQLEEAVRAAEADIGELLTTGLAGKVNVYYGTP